MTKPFCILFSIPSVPESPQLSSPLSSSKPDLAHDDSGPECCGRPRAEPVDGDSERPVSLVSTLSSGSSRDSRSLFGSTTALPSSTTPPAQSEEDIDLELSPAEGATEQAGRHSPTLAGSRGCWQARLDSGGAKNQWDDNVAACDRKGSGGEFSHTQTSPVIADTMAPNPKLTYVDRVVMEIIETERMYVKDLRSIVEVSECLHLNLHLWSSATELVELWEPCHEVMTLKKWLPVHEHPKMYLYVLISPMKRLCNHKTSANHFQAQPLRNAGLECSFVCWNEIYH